MNDYKKLIGDINDLLIAHPSENVSKMYLRKAADAIEQIVAEYNELDNAHGELFIEYHKVKKQRDAAIAWLPKACGYCKHYNGLTCNNKDCRNISGVNTGWEWRGEQALEWEE